jgi:hypothetical protein
MKVQRIIHDLWYKFKCQFFHPYNIIKIKTLPKTWSDRDKILCHAMFQVLSDFVKKERIDEIIDWQSDEDHKKARAKMDELINWFHNTYLIFDAWSGVKLDYDYKNSLVKTEDNPVMYTLKPMSAKDRKKIKNIIKKENEMEEELNKKLIEILSIRKYLWT